MRILSTKQLEGSLIAKTSGNGVAVTCIDVIRTTPLDFDLSILSPGRFDTIVFTSANAVKLFFYYKKLIFYIYIKIFHILI